jgi:hypothetical protein
MNTNSHSSLKAYPTIGGGFSQTAPGVREFDNTLT